MDDRVSHLLVITFKRTSNLMRLFRFSRILCAYRYRLVLFGGEALWAPLPVYE